MELFGTKAKYALQKQVHFEANKYLELLQCYFDSNRYIYLVQSGIFYSVVWKMWYYPMYGLDPSQILHHVLYGAPPVKLIV